MAFIIENKGSERLRKHFKNLESIQEKDPKCMLVIADLEVPNSNLHSRYRVIDNILCKNSPHGFFKITVPEKVAKPLILGVHEAYAYIGKKKIKIMIEEDFRVFRLRSFLSEMLNACDSCQRNKYAMARLQPLLQPILTDHPRELLSIDFYGRLPTSTAGAKYMLTTIDVFRKFVVMYPIKKGEYGYCN